MLRAAGLLLDGGARYAPPVTHLLRAAALVLAALAFSPLSAAASERIELRSAELQPAADGEGIVLNAAFDFELPWTLEDAVNRGVPLYFVVDFELFRSRWYWLDERRVATSLTYRLSFSPLSRQYRLARGTLALSFETLGSALAALRRVSNWTVIESGALAAGSSYWAQVRMRLDTAQLPRPFQIGALTSRDWTLASDWRNVPVKPELAR
jgi:hypothetical protein